MQLQSRVIKNLLKYSPLARRYFNSNSEFNAFAAIAVSGVIVALFCYHMVDGFKYNSGKDLGSLFFSPVLTIAYFTIAGYKYQFDRTLLAKSLLLYGLQIAPFSPLFLQVFQPVSYDDFSRYYQYAQHMLSNRTLWGSDKIFYKNAALHYVTQPGYRYLIYLELLTLGRMCRVLTFVHIAMYVVAVFYFQKTIKSTVNDNRLRLNLLLLAVLFSPYAIKNSMLGLPEWVTAVLLILSVYFYKIKQWNVTAMLVLGLVPFFRQNLLAAIILIAIWILINNPRKTLLTGSFLATLLLPVYHNLYYAGEWRFFVDIHRMPFYNYPEKSEIPTGINYDLICSNIIHYTGFEMENRKLSFSIIAFIFLPFAVYVYYLLIKSLKARRKIFFILITGSVAVPVIFLGSAYYPRFEFLNVVVMALAYSLLSHNAGSPHLKFVSMKPWCKHINPSVHFSI